MLDLTDHILRKAHGLNLTTYAVLTEIYYLSHNQKYAGWCVKTKENIAKTLDVSKDTVNSAINSLIKKGLVEKEQETRYVRTTDKWNNIISDRDNVAVKFQKEEDETENPSHRRKIRHIDGKSVTAQTENPSLIDGKSVTNNIQEYIQENNIKNIPSVYQAEPEKAGGDLEKKEEHGRPEINQLLNRLKDRIGIDAFADSGMERNFAMHLLALLRKIGPNEFSRRLDIILSDGFKHRNCNRIRYLYGEMKGFIAPPSRVAKI